MHYFNMSFDDVVWNISWANLIMLQSSVPKLNKSGEEKPKKEASPQGFTALLNSLNK